MGDLRHDRDRYARSAVAYIRDNFSSVAELIPPDATPFSLGYGVLDGIATLPEDTAKDWCTSYGYGAFVAADLRRDLFAAGIQNRGSSEYLLAMWTEDDRRFWFYDTYVCFVAETDRSVAATNDRLCEALYRWRRGDRRVLFSGPRGGWISELDAAD